MSMRTIAVILIYAIITIVAYIILRVLDGLDDDDGSKIIAWILAIIWPALIGFIIAIFPFYLIGTGIDKIIYSVQTRILEAKIHKR